MLLITEFICFLSVRQRYSLVLYERIVYSNFYFHNLTIFHENWKCFRMYLNGNEHAAHFNFNIKLSRIIFVYYGLLFHMYLLYCFQGQQTYYSINI